MFENIIGQDRIISILKDDIVKKSLNNSMLFYGKKYTGKLTTAFELARILNCKNNKSNDCSCINCEKIKNFTFEGVLFLSRRDFSILLNEYIRCCKEQKDLLYLKKIINIIKIISLTYQDFLIKDTINEADKKKIASVFEKINEIFENNGKINDKALDNLLKLVFELNQIYKTLNIPVDMLRNMLDWTYIKKSDTNKVVIIDHFDSLEKSSQNVLLKRVEEPEKNLYFILLSESKNKINRTILSRCRTYYFPELDKKNTGKILKSNFKDETLIGNLENYFLRNETYSKEKIYNDAAKFINLVFQKESPFSELSLFLNSINDKKYFKAFLNELTNSFEKDILRREEKNRNPEINSLDKCSLYNLRLITDLLKKRIPYIDIYNLNTVLFLEGIFYPVKAMVQNDRIKLSYNI